VRSKSQNPDWGIIDLSGCDAEIFGEVASNIRRARIVHLVSVLERIRLEGLICKRVSRSGVRFCGAAMESKISEFSELC